MADLDQLAQLQKCYDDLATQFYASLRYISSTHGPSPLPGNASPPQAAAEPCTGTAVTIPTTNGTQSQSQSQSQSQAQTQMQTQNTTITAATPLATTQSTTLPASHSQPPILPSNPASPSPFPPQDPSTQKKESTLLADTHELSQDLILKTKQIQALIGRLPGLGRSKEEQEARIGELEGELREVGREEEGVRGEVERWREGVEGVIVGGGAG